MNAYDFDETIYDGDCTFDFYRHCFSRFLGVRKHALSLIGPGTKFLFGKLDKTLWKQQFFGFLRSVEHIDLEIALFWDRNEKKIKRFYRQQQRADDLIISASPEFLLWPVMRRLSIKQMLGSPVDLYTGRYLGKNCHGEEKVRRLNVAYPDVEIDDFYSDSLSDLPMAKVAKRAFLVKGNRIREWRIS